MKICLPPHLCAALVAALSFSSFTISSAHAAGVAETNEELKKNTLTELNADEPALYPKPSAYQLEEVIGDVELDLFHITKYLYDAGTYTPIQYNVVFDEPLGDIKPEGEEYTYFKWEKVINPDTKEDTGRIDLVSTTDFLDADIKAYTRENKYFEGDGTITIIERSFLGLEKKPEENNVAFGGAFYNSPKSETPPEINVVGDFIDNSASTSGASGSAHGGAIFNIGDFNNIGLIGSITGNFIGNSAFSFDGLDASAGAIHNEGDIQNITGDFIGNSASAHATYATHNIYGTNAVGGVIHNTRKIGSISGDFRGNYVTSSRSGASVGLAYAYGGAIYNQGELNSIAGDFNGNFASAYASGSVDSLAEAMGGVVYNGGGKIGSITGDFIGNFTSANASVVVDGGAYAQGGAFYNLYGSIGFLALERSMQFVGNYTCTDGGTTKTYEAIYNNGKQEAEAILNFNAYDKNSIVVNDGIAGNESAKDYQITNINNGRDGKNLAVDASRTDYATVAFNSFVDNQSIIVHAGELHLGKFTGIGKEGDANYIPSTQATLNNSSLTIKAGALVSVQGQLELDSKSSISSIAEGVVNGASSLKGLAADSSILGGSITLAANSHLSMENITLTNIAIHSEENTRLSLKSVTIAEGIELSVTHLSLSYDNVAASSTVRLRSEAAPLSYTLSDIGIATATVTGSLTLGVNMIESEFDAFNTALAAGADIFFIVEGLESATLVEGVAVCVSVNGDAYFVEGMEVVEGRMQFSIIPEPSTASLSLLALAGLLARRRRKAA